MTLHKAEQQTCHTQDTSVPEQTYGQGQEDIALSATQKCVSPILESPTDKQNVNPTDSYMHFGNGTYEKV